MGEAKIERWEPIKIPEHKTAISRDTFVGDIE